MAVETEARFTVTYHVDVPTYEEAKAVIWAVQVEQTIEFPYDFVTDDWIKEHIVGQLTSLEPAANGGFDAVVAYNEATTAMEATQFLNVVFGNSSLQPHIWVTDVQLTPNLVKAFGGPRFGLSGIREMTGTLERPLLQAVIKPMGSSTASLAAMCTAYTRGGVDVIKDDHGITNQCFAPYKERVKRCAAAIAEANAAVGGHTLYAANVSADGEAVIERAYVAKEAGATALMVAPALIGYGWLHRLATDPALNMPIISHPAMMGGFALPGVSGIADHVWFALFPRIFGADMPIFVSYGGRFTFTAEQCKKIHATCTMPYHGMKAACPSPGGGVTAKRLPELMRLYGPDTMYLVGGDMFRRGNDLEANTQFFIEILQGR